MPKTVCTTIGTRCLLSGFFDARTPLLCLIGLFSAQFPWVSRGCLGGGNVLVMSEVIPPPGPAGDLDQNGRGQGARTALGSFRVALGVPRCTRRRSAPGPVGSFVMFWPGCRCGPVVRDGCDVAGLAVGGFARHVSGQGRVLFFIASG